MKAVRILLADDHTIVRAGIRSLLESPGKYEVVAEASNGHEALELARALRPDIVLMDIAMPGVNGLEATATLTRELPDTRVIILSMHAGEDFVRQALRAGAAAYLLKESATQELDLAIAAVMAGNAYLSPTVSRQVVAGYVGNTPDGKAAAALTPRQREVLKLVAEGKSTKEIAHLLGVSGKTVETHRAQLMERLGIRDVAGLVRYAIRTGLVGNGRPGQ
ncbi:MAG: response regulator [Burkholderiales bacterium]